MKGRDRKKKWNQINSTQPRNRMHSFNLIFIDCNNNKAKNQQPDAMLFIFIFELSDFDDNLWSFEPPVLNIKVISVGLWVQLNVATNLFAVWEKETEDSNGKKIMKIAGPTKYAIESTDKKSISKAVIGENFNSSGMNLFLPFVFWYFLLGTWWWPCFFMGRSKHSFNAVAYKIRYWLWSCGLMRTNAFHLLCRCFCISTLKNGRVDDWRSDKCRKINFQINSKRKQTKKNIAA